MRRAAWLMVVGGCGLLAGAARGEDAKELDFAHDIVPILREHCGQCHTGDKKQGGFSMNTRESLLAGGDGGMTVVSGDSEASELMVRIVSDDPDHRMPPEGPRLPAEKVALLRAWIDGGVAWEDGFAFQQPAYEPPLLPRRPELPPAVEGRENPVDRIVDAYLAEHGVEHAEAVTDEVFARRAWLDLVGLLPPPDELQQFLGDTAPDKRDRLVRQLLADDVAYAENWLTFWNDLLRNDYTGTGFITGGRKQITGWLYRALVDNKPYDQFVRELIVPTPDSEGFIQGITWRGNVNASQTQEVQFAQSISQAFLGINMKCASCHDSFVDRWKLSEAYGLAAIYATGPLPIHRCDKPTGDEAQPAWIFPELGQIDPAAPQPERMAQLALLMTHPENGRFTRTIVNRLWHRLMGRGIVHPVDAMHTEPWSSDLVDFLAVDLADHAYDLKHTIGLIATSQAYQARTPAVDGRPDAGPYVFRGPLARRLTAEQFVDAVWQITAAAPVRPDADVLRFKLDPEASARAELTGTWVWAAAEASGAAPAGETITLRRQFLLPADPARAFAVVTCDNSYTLFANGRQVQADDNWETIEVVPLEAHLKAGMNELVLVARNGGDTPNPAGLFFEARLQLADGSQQAIVSGAEWQWTRAAPDGSGRFPQDPGDWQPAVPVAAPQVWLGAAGERIAASLAQPLDTPPPMVRASLVKSDVLMRALGRPNRDQIVSMRPSDLTTLEAIDLANGQPLADAIAVGARRLAGMFPESPDTLTTWLYQYALSRSPSDEELTTCREALSARPGEEQVQDLLWAVFMLPEFQLVR